MKSPALRFDLFVSYARVDNANSRVTDLVETIRENFERFGGYELGVFFDTEAIRGMDDWERRIVSALRESRLFLAFLSPAYTASQWCRREWMEYVRYEAMRHCLGEGVAPVYFVTLPGWETPSEDQSLAAWLGEMKCRQVFDLRPWYDEGRRALEHSTIAKALDTLRESLRERVERAERARRSPGNILEYNPAFVGRAPELTSLRETLARNRAGILGTARNARAAGVQGLGGMGKTELALAYAHAFAWDYPGGRWQVGCDGIDDLRVALRKLASPLGFEFTEDEKKDADLGLQRVVKELKKRERMLLLLDNVTSPALFRPDRLDHLPRGENLDLIVTSRLPPGSIPGSAATFTFIAVDELPRDDAVALMRSHQPEGHFSSEEEDRAAREIVEALGGFTLAVETAAIFLGRHSAPDACSQFLTRLKVELFRESEIAASQPEVAVRHYERLLEPTLRYTLETLTPEALEVLIIAALLPPDQIALPWLRAVAVHAFPALSHDTSWEQLRNHLCGLRLLQAGQDVRVVRMHRMVQDLIIRKYGDSATRVRVSILDSRDGTKRPCRNRAEGLLALLAAHAVERGYELRTSWVDVETRWELAPLLATVSLLLERKDHTAAFLANAVHTPLLELGRFEEATQLAERALAVTEAMLNPLPRELARACSNLAALRHAANELPEAEALIRRAAIVLEDGCGSYDPDLSSVFNNLAVILRESGNLREAEQWVLRALDIDTANPSPDGFQRLSVLSNQALILASTDRYGEAEAILRQILQLQEERHGVEHPDVALALINLAEVQKHLNHLSEAEPLLRRALKIDEAILGVDHPRNALILGNLGDLLHDLARNDEAEHVLRHALAINEASFGPNHPAIARDLNNLGRVLAATGRIREAEECYRRSMAVEGREKTNAGRTLLNLAAARAECGDFGEAEDLGRQGAEMLEQSLGPDHSDIAGALINLAVYSRERGRLQEAEAALQRALRILVATYGEQHPSTAAAIGSLGVVFEAMGRAGEAESMLRRALTLNEACFGLDHPKVATALQNLGKLLHLSARSAEAEPLQRRALGIDERISGLNHPSVVRDLTGLAETLTKLGKLEEAKNYLMRATEMLDARSGTEDHGGKAHSMLAATLNDLAMSLHTAGKRDEAERLMRQSLALDETTFGGDHPTVARRLTNLGSILQDRRQFADAEALLRRALVIDEKHFGPEDPNVARGLNNLACLLLDTGRAIDAEPMLHRAFAIDQAAFGMVHELSATRLNNLAQALQNLGKYDQAERFFARVVAIFFALSRRSGQPHPHLTPACMNYAQFLMQRGASQDEAQQSVHIAWLDGEALSKMTGR